MRTQNLLKSILGLAVIAAQLFTTSCDSAGNPSALVGRWVCVFGAYGKADDNGDIMDLLSDGTGIYTKGSRGLAITWKTEKDRFYITASGQAQSESYKLQGSLLTFTDDNGKVSKFTKCKKDCKEAVAEYTKAEAEEAAKEYAKAEAEQEKAKAEKSASLRKKSKKGSFKDTRDKKSYKTVKLDDQTWMAENLNYEIEGSKCYGDEPSNCQKYGRLYNWETAKSVCPSGWHLPNDDEWGALVDLARSSGEAAGAILKASSGWASDGNGTDALGFAALSDGGGYNGFWWTASENNVRYAYSRSMSYYNNEVIRSSNGKNNSAFSVRCVQD